MKTNRRLISSVTLLTALVLLITFASTRLRADSGSCGGATISLPFTDVAGNVFFCEIAEAFFSGLTNGTTPTTYSPSQNVPREQMAAFVARTMDQSLRRGSRRAALKQFWTPTSADGIGLTTVGSAPEAVETDGADLWVANFGSGTVSRVRASDGKLLETWTGATAAFQLVAAKGLIFVTGFMTPGRIYQIDPTQPAGAVTILTSLVDAPTSIAFDGARIWTASQDGAVSIITLNPLSVTRVTAGFIELDGLVYDGANMWVTDQGTNPNQLIKLDSNGGVIQRVPVGEVPRIPVFDGTNIWVPSRMSSTITVVRASTGTVVATLTGNGLNQPVTAAFDGERILVPNIVGDSVSLWKAADLSPLGSIGTGSSSGPTGACSDGLNFWVTLNGPGKLARF